MFRKIFVLTLVLSFLFAARSFSQTTIILVRHAEKAAATGEMSATDPDLSEAGYKRADNLVTALKEYKPDMFYSTNYVRTKKTITPLAAKFSKDIQSYDPRRLNEFAEELKKAGNKTIVVAGHSNTTPALVNLLIGENKYQPLDESVYNKIWVVTIGTDGKISEKQMEY